MSRIISYQYDNVVQDGDAWVGTEVSSRRTKQYTAAAVAEYLNTNGKVIIGGQTTYRFTSVPYNGIGTFAPLTGNAGNRRFGTLDYISISGEDIGGQSAEEFLGYLVGSDIMISKQSDMSSFGHYTVTGFAFEKGDFYNMTLSYIGGPKGSIELDEIYNIFTFTLPSSSSGDKAFIFSQVVPSSQWTINHNLNKFPSVSVVDSNNSTVQGLVTYISNSELTINFSAGFSGKAYLN
jgi:hypothetical protein